MVYSNEHCMTMRTHHDRPEKDYDTLLLQVEQANLFERTRRWYFVSGAIALTGLITSLYVVTLTDSLIIQVINAVAFGFFGTQLGIIGHDLSHGQVFSGERTNRLAAMFVWGLFLGLSESNWHQSHNRHHKNPNHISHDPALDIPFVFTPEQTTLRSHFFKKWFVPYQHILYWPGLCFIYPATVAVDMRYLFKNISLQSAFEIALMILHFILLFTLIFTSLPVLTGLLFLAVGFVTAGLYMAVIFAPNHEGCPMLAPEDDFHWTYQITFTRNLLSTPFYRHFFGGLDSQIEHHLFPHMSRYQFKKARAVVRQYCAENNLTYHETSFLTSFSEIYQSLKDEAHIWQKRSSE